MGKLSSVGAVVLLMTAGAGVAFGQNRLNGPDQEIVTQLHRTNQNEIRISSYVQPRVAAEGAKDLAATLRQHHGEADQRLLVYAQRRNMNMATIGQAADAMAHGELAMRELTNARPGELDYLFAQRMVAEHQAAIDMAESAQRIARDPELRALIGEMLPTLRAHLDGAQRLVASLPEPTPRTVQLPGMPAGVSRTRTGADEQRGIFEIPVP